ncbi:MAG TPA: heme ABC transporter permease CcmB [Armatimonadetes bacterium]|nr:heme ABC transporter permease CcmB [Armatimonadota bacterium]
MATKSSSWVREAYAILRKDFLAEFRTRYALSALGMFALITLVAVSFALGPTETNPAVHAALLWLILFFAAMSGLSRTFVREEETRTVNALRLAAAPLVVYAGKWAFNLGLQGAVELLIVPLFLVLLNVSVGNFALFLAVLVVGSVGLTVAATFVAAIVAKARARGSLFAVLAFPLLVPLLLTAIKGTTAALQGRTWAEGWPEVGLLLSYTGTFAVVTTFLFAIVWTE